MSQQREAPPPGVETLPEDVQEELNLIDRENEKKVLQKVMDDPDFGRRLIEEPTRALKDAEEELGLADETEGHHHGRAWITSWRWKCFYSYWQTWAHHTRHGWRF